MSTWIGAQFASQVKYMNCIKECFFFSLHLRIWSPADLLLSKASRVLDRDSPRLPLKGSCDRSLCPMEWDLGFAAWCTASHLSPLWVILGSPWACWSDSRSSASLFFPWLSPRWWVNFISRFALFLYDPWLVSNSKSQFWFPCPSPWILSDFGNVWP